MGEVGSGKTVVALYAMLRAVEHGHQAALMAPTETLAEQHFATLQRLIGAEPVTRGAADRLHPGAPARGHPGQAGERRAVVDRRHACADRAGRRLPLAGGGGGGRAAPLRRAPAGGARRRRGRAAHAAHDRDADPAHARAGRVRGPRHEHRCASCRCGRQAIDTRWWRAESERERAYSELRGQLRAGRQAYVVCPLVEEAGPRAGRRRSSVARWVRQPPTRPRGACPGARAATAELRAPARGRAQGI